MCRRIERLDEYIAQKGISSNSVEATCGLSKGLLSKARAGKTDVGMSSIQKILEKFQDLNRVWLLTGEGSMFNTPTPTTNEEKEYTLIPLIDIDSVGGMRSSNAITDSPQYTERLVPFENAQQGDIAIHQSGESMSPTIPAGSILQIRRVPDWQEYIGYGDIYVLELNNGRRLTKEITRYDDDPSKYVLCVSHNSNYPPEPLPRTMIKSMWKVIRILTELGW